MKQLISLPVANELGEGVIWDHRRQRAWWTDIERCRLYRYDPVAATIEQWETPERLACFAPVAGQDYLVCAFASGFAFYRPETNELEWIKQLESDNPGTRLNDGRTDRQGRFWAGTMTEAPKQAIYKGSLYCLNSHLSISKHIDDLAITNSLCWSPDGQVMYHCDTPSRTIQQYDFTPASGELAQAKTIIKTDPGCFPDGSCIDAQGYLWNAQWGGHKIVRYSPSGDVDLELKVPVSQPSCVAFGGTNFDLLFVTTARQGLSEEQLEAEPEAGNVFIFQTEFQGLKDSEFVVDSSHLVPF